MYREQLIALLKGRNQEYSISGKEIKTKCLNPEHDDGNPSFSINYATGLAYCFSCQFKTHADRILGIKLDEDQERLSKYRGLNSMWEAQEDIEEQKDILLPPVANFASESFRGISKELLQELGVYQCSHGRYKDRMVFPIKDAQGILIGFDARINGDNPQVPDAKYLRPQGMKTVDILYPLDYLWNHRDTMDLSSVVLTEGIMDALSYIQLGVPAVCNFGLSAPSPLKAGRLLSLGTMTIINGLDADAPAVKAWQGDIEKDRVGLKDIWRRYVTIGKPVAEVLKVKRSGFKDCNEYLQSLSKV